MTFSIRTNPVSLLVGAAILLIVLTVIAIKLAVTPVGVLLVVFVVAIAILLVLIGAASLRFSLERLQELLEPKTGTVSYSFAGAGAGAEPSGSFRDELAHSLAVTLAPHLCHRLKAGEFGAYIRSAVDEIHGVGGNSAALDTAKATLAVYDQLASNACGLMEVGSKTLGEKTGQEARQADANAQNKDIQNLYTGLQTAQVIAQMPATAHPSA